MQKILVIQTAFIGDVVLATGLLESLHKAHPSALIDILVRKGNEALFLNHPFLHEVLVWDKNKYKYQHLIKLIQQIRHRKYDQVINLQRFAATGFITVFCGAKVTIGFDKNPFSPFFTKSVKHIFSKGDKALHEIERNHQLIAGSNYHIAENPKLYPSKENIEKVQSLVTGSYICIAPASVWFTKQFPAAKWVSLIQEIPAHFQLFLLGAPSDQGLCDSIILLSGRSNCTNLSGKLSFLESAALMQKATMNYVNDSAPMHFASAMNAPVTAIYCSTLPAFGYGPLSEQSHIVEIKEALACRPCGIHGKKVCPESHFNCANQINNGQLLAVLPS